MDDVPCILLVDDHALSCHDSVEYLQGCKWNSWAMVTLEPFPRVDLSAGLRSYIRGRVYSVLPGTEKETNWIVGDFMRT